MSDQKSLLPSELVPVVERPPKSPLADLRTSAMSVDVESMQAGLEDYAERRAAFRKWLLAQLKEGVHYGYPPGCEPRKDDRGWFGVYQKGKDGERGGYKYYPPEQWTAKPSLYKAGAEFVCDLMGARAEYDPDMDGWKQLGEPKGTFVYRCRLYSKTNGELLGEGRGVRKVGDKGGNENNAIKMAKKAAHVDSVLSTYGLSDLFTQDLEEKQPHDNPDQRTDAPKVTPRAQRVSAEQLTAMQNEWRSFTDGPPIKDAFLEFCKRAAGDFNAGSISEWTQERLRACRKAMGMEEPT